MKSKGRESLLWAILLISVLSVNASPLWPQSGTTGALTGTVADVEGTPLPGATVTLNNDATGQAQVATTDTDGLYGFPTLAPGSYAIKFSAEGFMTAQLPPVVVNVSEDSVVGAKLQAGETAQPVLCQCAVTHTASSSSGTLVGSKEITAVPLTTRNFTQVLGTAAGAASNVNNAGLLGAGSQSVNVSGNTATSTYTIDGARAGAVPNPDTITQFRIQTSQYDSGYGAHVPTTNLITKSGTNDFHGDLWEFVRNDIFNANAFFLNGTGQPKPNLKQNQFGGTIGGPIKKNKFFLFGTYQGTRQVSGLDPQSLSTVIQPPLTNDRSAATIGSQFCPGNKPAADQAKYKTFAGGSQVVCDGSNINPVALKILQLKLPDGTYLIPTPQTVLATGPNAGLGFSSYSRPSRWDEDQYLVNTDYVISRKHTLAGRFFSAGVHQLTSIGVGAPNAGPNTGAAPTNPSGPKRVEGRDYVTSVRFTSVLTSNLVNQTRVAFTRTTMEAFGSSVTTAATPIGMIPVDPFVDEAPGITVQGSLGVFRIFENGQKNLSTTDTYQWSDNISWVHGRHTIRTGVFFDTATQEVSDTRGARGTITFQNFTDFLVGLSAAQNGSPSGLSNIDSVSATVGAGPRGELHNQYRTDHVSAFIQDDVKVNPRFTFNMGLRWEYLAASFDPAGQLGNASPSLLYLAPIPPASGTYIGNTVAANYDPNTLNPYTGQPFGPPPQGVITRDTKSMYQNDAPLKTFAPRIGFAWQPGGKQKRLAARGGYGWFYQTPTPGGNAANSPQFTAQPFAQGFSNTSTSNNLSTLQKPFPTATLGFQSRTPTSQLSDRVGGPDYKIPLLQQWNLNVQVTLFPTLTLDVGYVGSNGTDLLFAHGLNQPLLASASNPVNCGYNGGDPTNLANCITTNTSKNAALRVPILGETPAALAMNEYGGRSRYNGLQATLRKQASSGLTFQVSYTYSKSMSNTTWLNDQRNGRLNWARAPFDRTQRLVFNYTYQLPGLRRSGFAGAMLSGWSMSGVTSIQTGTPMTLTDRRAGSVYGRGVNSTITICPGATYESLATSGSNQSRLGAWFNVNQICAPPAIGSDTPEATGYGNAGQSIVMGPGQSDWDISVGKATRVGGIREDSELQLRVEFYNAFNHPQFSNPGTVFGTASFGVITQTSVAPRLIQFGIKYLF